MGGSLVGGEAALLPVILMPFLVPTSDSGGLWEELGAQCEILGSDVLPCQPRTGIDRKVGKNSEDGGPGCCAA